MTKELKTESSLFLKIFLVFFFTEEFSLLTHVPIPFIKTISSTLYLMVLGIVFSYYLLRDFQKRQISMLLIILFPLILIPFISALQASNVFGQPFIYGFLAERTKFFILSPFLIMYLLDSGRLSIQELEKHLIQFAFIYFAIALFLYIFINPEYFSNTSFVRISPTKGVIYNINHALIIILLFYSLYKIFERFKPIYAITIIAIIIYLIVLVKGRSLLTTVFIAIIHFTFIKLSQKQKLLFLSISLMTLFGLGAFGLFFFQGRLSSVFDLFASALNVFVGDEAQDPSAASRVIQVDVAWSGFKDHPLLGNGFISSEWNEGFKGQYKYFFPSDVGWLGILFIHGIIGFLILNIPFIASFIFSRKIPNDQKTSFYNAIESFMLYIFFHSIFAAFSIKKIGMIAFPFAIIYFFRYQRNAGQVESSNVTTDD
jgi:O-antigen ligase